MKKRADYQVTRDGAGRVVGYRKQMVHPLTGRPMNLTGDSPEEVMGYADRVKRTRRELRNELITVDELRDRLASVKGNVKGLAVPVLWERYLSKLETEWRMTGRTGPSTWAAKVRGMGALHVLPESRLGAFSAPELTEDVMTRWAEKVLKTVGEKTLQNIYICVSAAVGALVSSRKMAALPWGEWRVKVSRAQREVGRGRAKLRDGDEFARMLRAAREEDETCPAGKLPDLANRLGVLCMLGFRRGEAVAFSWEDVSLLPSGDIQVSTKHQAVPNWRRDVPRGIPLADARPMTAPKCDSTGHVSFSRTSALARFLAAQRILLEEFGLFKPTGPVFPDRFGNYRARDVIAPHVMRRLAVAAGLSSPGRWVQHSTRHSTATMLLAAGASPRDAMAIVRHKNLETFQGYIAETGRSNIRLPDAIGEAGARAMQEPAQGWAGLLDIDAPPVSPVKLVASRGEVLAASPAPVPMLDDVAMLSASPDEARAASRRHHAEHLGRQVFDFGEAAWEEWVAMGMPMGRDDVKLDRDALPATVKSSAVAAAKRAQEKERREQSKTGIHNPKKLQTAYRIGYSRACNGWTGIRRSRVLTEIESGRWGQLPLPVMVDAMVYAERKSIRLPAAAIQWVKGRALAGEAPKLVKAKRQAG